MSIFQCHRRHFETFIWGIHRIDGFRSGGPHSLQAGEDSPDAVPKEISHFHLCDFHQTTCDGPILYRSWHHDRN